MKIKMCTNFTYRVQDKNIDILKLFNTSKENITRNNNALELYNGEWLKIKVNDYETHFVKPAETLSEIAKKYNISVEKIAKDNNLKSDKLFIGQTLKIYI